MSIKRPVKIAVKDIEVKREVCFTSLAWMPASEGWHVAGMTA
jgi:hypothetical protein